MTDEPDSSADVVPRAKQNLETPWVRARLLRELALAEKTAGVLAEEYGVSRSAISMFKSRNKTEVQLVADNLADQYADLWIANKRNRLATLAAAAEKLAKNPDARSAEVLAKLLKDAAEELGDIPNKAGVQINQANVTYSIEGVNLDDLR